MAIKEHHRAAGSGETSSPSESQPPIDRFLREARITGRLDHPSIVPVYEIGLREDGSAFYSMKFVRGQSLAHTLREIDKSFDDEREKLAERLKLLDNFVSVCEAIAYAHSKGIVHRDLKPDNIMLGGFSETLVVDWGLAKVRGEADSRADRAVVPEPALPDGGGTTLETYVKALEESSVHESSSQQNLSELKEHDLPSDSAHADSDISTKPAPERAKPAPMMKLKKEGSSRCPSSLASSNPTLEIAESNTLAGTVLGTPTYMPPEQAKGLVDEVDELSDIYALGAILY